MGTTVTLNISSEKLWNDYQEYCKRQNASPSSRVSSFMEKELKKGDTDGTTRKGRA